MPTNKARPKYLWASYMVPAVAGCVVIPLLVILYDLLSVGYLRDGSRIMILPLAIVIPFTIGYILISHIQRIGRRKGYKIMARVQSVESAFDNDLWPRFRIIAVDPNDSGKTYVSGNISGNAEKFRQDFSQKDIEIPVYINPKDSSKYTVDTSEFERIRHRW